MPYMCPICGYPELDEPAYDETESESFEICPSCRFQFGVTDYSDGYTFEQWRNKWIAEGMIWDKGQSEPPEGWNPRQQLLNLNKLK